jgi:hypothetical protein
MMPADLQSHLAFHMTGVCRGDALPPIDGSTLRPALLANYRDLAALRYDFPVVLLRSGADVPYASLSNLIDSLAAELPETADRERLRKQLLRVEQEIRRLTAAGKTGALEKLWDLALARIPGADRDPVLQGLRETAGGRKCNGQVIDCDAAFPSRALLRAWRHTEEEKAARFRAEVERLTLGLRGMLRADFGGSEAGLEPARLRASMGLPHQGAFDFERMSALLKRTTRSYGLTRARRERIEKALRVLESQPFFPAGRTHAGDAIHGIPFVFTSCADVLEAFRERMPLMVEMARSMAIAELELSGEYNAAHHDAFFEAYRERGLRPDELKRFPSYLLCQYSGTCEEYTELMALLEANIPLKALVQLDDLVEPSHLGNGRLALSLRGKQLADMAIGLASVYVLQASASHLVQMRSQLLQGLFYEGPALFSIFSGATPGSALPPYLAAAAAMESRVFPAFTYDPSAGAGWAERFSIAANPQPERDWPVQPLQYEDRDRQRVTETIDFTFVEFAACDPRYAEHFARVDASACNGHLAPVQAWLAASADERRDKVPFVRMVDARDVLQTVIVDERLMQEAQRFRNVWHSLQELGGIHNSHAARLLEHERRRWEEERRSELEGRADSAAALAIEPAPAKAEATMPASAETAPPAAPEPSSDEPYIETPRCTTCEECVQINGKMFAYDANKQAYIADLAAGSYRQLVEAAEACQVSIIHPGKPRNASEPGLEELLERAAAFR